MAMRLCTAHSVVTYLKMGMRLEAAGREAVADLAYLVDPYFGRVSLIAMDAQGNHAGFSNGPDQTYLYLTDDMTACVEEPRIFVETGDRGRSA
jgi:isoaspartyl peptidase/L-asparaginase-like protein (Ntn-hydrolase superfamily)